MENRIFTCIVSPEEMADKASEELYDIRRKIKAKAAAIRQRLDGMIHSTHYQKFLQEPIVTQRGSATDGVNPKFNIADRKVLHYVSKVLLSDAKVLLYNPKVELYVSQVQRCVFPALISQCFNSKDSIYQLCDTISKNSSAVSVMPGRASGAA